MLHADVPALVDPLLERVDALEREVVELRREVAVLKDPTAKVAAFVEAVAAGWGEPAFVLRDLVEWARAEPLRTRRAVRRALEALGDPRQAGKALRAHAGRVFGEHRLVRVGSSRDGAVWAVRPAAGRRA